ncbi:hypothetical protein [Lampropedia cohaerens]|uniref:hypothetical protein n=1 Tax=Lampropedia cohaerens TaxID=1610491 RepID=UPI0012DFEEB9|nr:hypothetical protein [Lampropedia cohaerens]
MAGFPDEDDVCANAFVGWQDLMQVVWLENQATSRLRGLFEHAHAGHRADFRAVCVRARVVGGGRVCTRDPNLFKGRARPHRRSPRVLSRGVSRQPDLMIRQGLDCVIKGNHPV